VIVPDLEIKGMLSLNQHFLGEYLITYSGFDTNLKMGSDKLIILIQTIWQIFGKRQDFYHSDRLYFPLVKH